MMMITVINNRLQAIILGVNIASKFSDYNGTINNINISVVILLQYFCYDNFLSNLLKDILLPLGL